MGRLSRFAAKVAKKAATKAEKNAVKAAESAPELRVKPKAPSPLAVKPKAAPRALPAPPKPLALPAPGPGLPEFAVKPKGGQWWADKTFSEGNYSPEAAARSAALKLALTRWVPDEDYGLIVPGAAGRLQAAFETPMQPQVTETAAQKWLERALTKYYKNEFGTPNDPLRSLAEQGLHYDPDMTPERWDRTVKDYLIGDPISSIMFPPNRAGGMPGAGDDLRGETLAAMPWLAKAPATDSIYGISSGGLDLGHFTDEFLNVLNDTEGAGLPSSFAVRPESLDRMTFPQAVEHVGRINQWRAKEMERAALSAMDNPAIHTFKEYAEDNPMGLRWVELKLPDPAERFKLTAVEEDGKPFWRATDPDTGEVFPLGGTREQAIESLRYQSRDPLQQALKYEGDTMGHCVGGYCDDVLSGRSRIFSLRDAKGEPHVTIETQPSSKSTAAADHLRNLGVLEEWQDYWKNYPKTSNNNEDIYDVTQQFLAARDLPPVDYSSQNIIQIKGKQNRAPKDDYLPFVQDFVKSQQWGNVGDIENTGLVELPDGRFITQQQWKEGLGSVVSPWRNPGQYDERYLKNLSKAEWEYMAPYFEGFAIGGRVDADRCFCRHPMAVKR